MPLGIKVASAFFVIYAAISLVWGFSYFYLIGQSRIAWRVAVFFLGVAIAYVWVGLNLHRGTTLLWIGRILGLLAIVGGLSSFGNHSLITDHPGIVALVIARILIGVVITISLFLPGVGRAPTPPSPAGRGGK